MRKKSSLPVILAFVFCLLALSVLGGPGTSYGDDEAVGVGGDETGDQEGIDTSGQVKGDTNKLNMEAALVCPQDERDDGNTLPTISSEFLWFDGSADVDGNLPETKISYAFDDETPDVNPDCEPSESILSGGLFGGSEDPDIGCDYGWRIDTSNRMDFNPYSSNMNMREPFITLNLNSKGWPNQNPRLIRYEGGCRILVRNSHTKYPKQDSSSNKKKKGGKHTYEVGRNQDPGGGIKWKKTNSVDRNIDWDDSKTECELLGGEWLDNEVDNPEKFAHDTRGGSYRCCGDDWIWVYNRPINYDSSLKRDDSEIIERVDDQELCLYNRGNAGTPVGVEGFKTGNPYYRCHKASGEVNGLHTAYDPALTLDEATRKNGDRDGMMAKPGDTFFFAGPVTSSRETDIGKWSNKDGSKEMFCYHEFDSSSENGEEFSWISLEEAGNKNQLICDAYLGQNWTGTQCCRQGKTYNDIKRSCDARDIVYSLAGESGVAFSSPEFEEKFMEQCQMAPFKNLACYEGEGVENNTAVESSSGKKDVFNKKGELYFCNRSSGEQIKTEFEHVEKCSLKGPDKHPAICAYKNDSWYNTYEAEELLGWRENDSNRETIKKGLHLSSLPDFDSWPDNLNEDIQEKECCYFDSCWNGSECVSKLDRQGMYQMENKEWSPMSGGVTSGKKNYMCYKGEWLERNPKFNWYYDTSPQRTSLCPDAYSCVCGGGETDVYDYSCGEENVNEFSCTKEKNFYTEDHFCQPVYDEGEIDTSRWTSRTKLVAQQLLKLAEGSDNYTLFCDDKDYSVNSPDKLEGNVIPYDINNVCAIEFDGKTVMGFSFNPEGSAENPMDKFLFGGNLNNGFMKAVNEKAGKGACDNKGLDTDPAEGKYRKCLDTNPRVWVNHNMNSVIYSKDGFNVEGEMEVPDGNSFESQKDEFTEVIENSDDSNLPEAAHLLNTASNFNRLYKLKRDDKEAFGFIETRVDPGVRSSGSDTPLRNFVAVKYNGFNEICDKTGFVKERDDILLYCNQKDNDDYVLGRSRDRHPDYWRDLAPKIRVI